MDFATEEQLTMLKMGEDMGILCDVQSVNVEAR